MNKIILLKDGTSIYRVSIIIFKKQYVEAWISGEDSFKIVPISEIETIS